MRARIGHVSGDRRRRRPRVHERLLRVVPWRTASRRLLEAAVPVLRTGRWTGAEERPARRRRRPDAAAPGRPVVLRGLRPIDAAHVHRSAGAARRGACVAAVRPVRGRAGGWVSGGRAGRAGPGLRVVHVRGVREHGQRRRTERCARVPECRLRAVQRCAGKPYDVPAAAATVAPRIPDAVLVKVGGGGHRWRASGPLCAGRDLRRAGGQVPGRDPGRATAGHRDRVPRACRVRAGRVRCPVAGQRDRLRVRVQETRAIPGRAVAGRLGVAGVHRGRGRSAVARVLAVRVRQVPVVRGIRGLGHVGRGADRASGAVRQWWRAEEPAGQEPGQPVGQPATGLRELLGHRCGRSVRGRLVAVRRVRARHALRVPGRVRVDVRHVGRRVVRAARVHQEAARGQRPPDRPVRRVLGVRVARARRAHRTHRRPAAARARRRGRVHGRVPAALAAQLLVPEPAVAGRAVRGAGRRDRGRQLRVVHRRRPADRHVGRGAQPSVIVHGRQPVARQPARVRPPVADDGPGVGVRAGRRRHRQRRRVDGQHGAQLVAGRVHIPRVRLQLGRDARAGRVPQGRVHDRPAHLHRRHAAQRVQLTTAARLYAVITKIYYYFIMVRSGFLRATSPSSSFFNSPYFTPPPPDSCSSRTSHHHIIRSVVLAVDSKDVCIPIFF